MRAFFLIPGLVFLIGLSACQGTPPRNANQAMVYIYGNPACPHCQHFEAKLKENQIRYTFYDIGEDEDRKAAMWALLKKHHPRAARVGLPIVQYKEQVFIRPEIEKFKKIYYSTP